MDFSTIDWQTLTDDELDMILGHVEGEIRRRQIIETAEQVIADEAKAFQDAIGRKPEDDWVQPTGAHDAYRKGATVTFDGKVWMSVIPNNVWQPGVAGWEHVYTDDGAGGKDPEPPAWVQPDSTTPYRKGDQVTFDGAVYESLIDGNVWSPSEYPAGWKKVSTT